MIGKWIYNCTVLILSLLIVSGCASSQFPTGEYTRQLEGQQISIIFEDNGSFAILRSGRAMSEGTYSNDGNQLTWTSDSSCPAPNDETATYSWILNDQILTFSLVDEDICFSRLYMLEKLSYEKQP